MRKRLVVVGLVLVASSVHAEPPKGSVVVEAPRASSEAATSKARDLYRQAEEKRKLAAAAHQNAANLLAQAILAQRDADNQSREADHFGELASRLADAAARLHQAEMLRKRAFDLRIGANERRARAAESDATAARLDEEIRHARAVLDGLGSAVFKDAIRDIEADLARLRAEAAAHRSAAAEARAEAEKRALEAQELEKRAAGLEPPITGPLDVKPFVIDPPKVLLVTPATSSSAAPAKK